MSWRNMKCLDQSISVSLLVIDKFERGEFPPMPTFYELQSDVFRLTNSYENMIAKEFYGDFAEFNLKNKK